MFYDYISEVRGDLSEGSKKAYATQLRRIAQANNLTKATPLTFITRMANKAVRNRTLDFITLPMSEQTLQGENLRLSAVKVVLTAEKDRIEEWKYDKLMKLLVQVGKDTREAITKKNGLNELNEKEEEAFKISWDEITEYANSYHSLNATADRDWILLNLILNNYEERDDIKYYVLLRTLEYADLRVWNYTKKPPSDHSNYLWIPKSKIYIQHSKTTGGIKSLGNGMTRDQAPMKSYPVRKELMDKIKSYIKTNKLKHSNHLFYTEFTQTPLSSNQFGKVFKKLLTPLNPYLTIGMVRKIYSNRPLPFLNHNQKKELNELVDHTIETESAFYKKNVKHDFTKDPIMIEFP